MKSFPAAVLACLLFISCQPARDENDFTLPVPNPTPSSSNTHIIGLVGTLSGPDSWRGDDAFKGADLAVHELNRELEANETQFELVTLDDRGDADRATDLVKELASSDRAVGIVYAGPPEGLPPAERSLSRMGVPAIICHGDLYGARLLSPHVFQTSPSFLWQSRRIVDYLLGDRGYRRIGLASEISLTGRTARKNLAVALEEEGAGLAGSVTYRPEDLDGARIVDALRRRRVQAVVIQASPPSALKIQRSLRLNGARYRNTRAARASSRATKAWVPQVVGFDQTMSAALEPVDLPAGTIASDSYDRGVHYLPIPNFARFRQAFRNWWDREPLGWERRSYDAVHMIGWAIDEAGIKEARPDRDLAPVLEKMDGTRFGGLGITLGPDDHTTVEQSTVGLWVVPRLGISVPELGLVPNSMPWVPLARGFSIDGERTDIQPQDWKWLFENAPPKKAPAPRLSRARFGVTTSSRDPIH
ncbi:MAG TPA: ABC transporter substrate-binding protein [Actinomycetota bacterium]|nr:ABC transporter substrate-binding protein [Actinomycetota bacterium]